MVKQSNSSFHNAVSNSLSTANALLPHITISTSTNPKPTRPSSLPTKSLSTRFVAKQRRKRRPIQPPTIVGLQRSVVQ